MFCTLAGKAARHSRLRDEDVNLGIFQDEANTRLGASASIGK